MGKRLKILTNGIIKENPVLVLLLGCCPFLAVTTQASNAIGMGAATTAVLLGSNIFISLLRKVISDKVRIPCYIVIIASFVTLVQMIVKAYLPSLNDSLGLFLPLIVVNCIILGRAEMFASKNSVGDSVLDAIGMGVGFTLAMLVMASIREIFGNGTWFGLAIPVLSSNTISILTMPAGGFAIFGILIAIINKVTKGQGVKKKEFGCEGCVHAAACGKLACPAEPEKEATAE
ncbi:MAG: electron transport complex subunit E [Oscillospiraceae bacterium]|nr:electron transport complex subunit E [Oscillospiraceae bacterium]MCD8254067.1 electron transport complex subunit E [Oscillospiraceae bacterium]MCD8342781.1 electron transport complex subunit E [Oscillospiraceae bacterium]MCD8374426.1 electron transport complex subunit E [Oscillospiraceae bacterium]